MRSEPKQPETVRTKIEKRDFRGKVRHGAEWLQLWAHPDDDLSAFELSQKRQGQLSFERQRASLEKLAVPLSGDEAYKIKLDNARPEWTRLEWSIARGRLARTCFERRYPPQLPGLKSTLCRARATALGLRRFPGLFEEFQDLSLRELEDAGCAHAFLAAQLPLERALVLVFADRWSGRALPLWDSGAVDMWAAWLKRRCPTSLPRLDQSLDDPIAFTTACDAFLDELSQSLAAHKTQPVSDPDGDRGDTGDGVSEDDTREQDDTLVEMVRQQLQVEDEAGTQQEESAPDTGLAPTERPDLLTAYTRQYDVEQPLSRLVTHEQALTHAQRLHAKYGTQAAEARKLSKALSIALRAKRQSDWQFDREEGLIDASRLAQIVAAPHRRRAFKQEFQSQDLDAALTLLIDCSGSMRGKWMDLTILATQAMGDALALAGVPFEVLGFTTTATNGGQSFKAWKAAGGPAPQPGEVWRLNDLRHIVAKGFNQPWRRPRDVLAGLCDPGLLKENIDHEAINWACTRLRAQPSSRRLLIVLSDGSPSCSTTERFAAPQALADGLHAALKQNSDIEIHALGLRHRAEAFYPAATLVKSEVDLAGSVLSLVRSLMI